MQSFSKTDKLEGDDYFDKASESGVNICETPRSKNMQSKSVKEMSIS